MTTEPTVFWPFTKLLRRTIPVTPEDGKISGRPWQPTNLGLPAATTNLRTLYESDLSHPTDFGFRNDCSGQIGDENG
jgi:hypothetical protein